MKKITAQQIIVGLNLLVMIIVSFWIEHVLEHVLNEKNHLEFVSNQWALENAWWAWIGLYVGDIVRTLMIFFLIAMFINSNFDLRGKPKKEGSMIALTHAVLLIAVSAVSLIETGMQAMDVSNWSTLNTFVTDPNKDWLWALNMMLCLVALLVSALLFIIFVPQAGNEIWKDKKHSL